MDMRIKNAAGDRFSSVFRRPVYYVVYIEPQQGVGRAIAGDGRSLFHVDHLDWLNLCVIERMRLISDL